MLKINIPFPYPFPQSSVSLENVMTVPQMTLQTTVTSKVCKANITQFFSSFFFFKF